MTPDIHHEVGRFESREAARHCVNPHTILVELADGSGEVVVAGPRGESE